MRKFLIMIMGALLIGTVSAQKRSGKTYFDKEIRFIMDNDVFTSLYRDQYYTSGLFGGFRKLHSPKDDSTFSIVTSFTLAQRLYTPKSLRWTDTREFDRPYAGLISVLISNEYYYPTKNYLKLQAELGVMGPASFSGPIHEQWHESFGLTPPEGWKYQIGNTPVINFYIAHAKSYVNHRHIDIVTETNVAFGSVFNYFRQELMMRLGLLRPLHKSVHFSGTLGGVTHNHDTNRAQEIYFFFSPGVEYNIHNASIEGRLIGGKDPHTEVAERWIYQNKLGFMFSWIRTDLKIFHYWRSREAVEATTHTYMGVQVNYRF